MRILHEQFKNGNFSNFLGILTIPKDQISYVKHVLDPFLSFSPYLGIWRGAGSGGVPRGMGHNLLMQLSTLYSSKMEIFGTDFFDILTTHNDQISYVKHVLDPLSFGPCIFFRRGLFFSRVLFF